MELLLHPVIARYFATKGGVNTEDTLDCFADDATIWDNGEDLELHGKARIREWMTSKIAGYKLTTEVRSAREEEGATIVQAIVSGDFPGSPYEFSYSFKLAGNKISVLAIDPIGSLAT
jgi:hypothetical protein